MYSLDVQGLVEARPIQGLVEGPPSEARRRSASEARRRRKGPASEARRRRKGPASETRRRRKGPRSWRVPGGGEGSGPRSTSVNN